MASRHWIEHEGRRIEIEAERGLRRVRVRLLVDGQAVAEGTTFARTLRLEGSAGEGPPAVVVLEPGLPGLKRTRYSLVAGEEKLALRPPPGSRAERLERMREERPGLFASRHVAKGVLQVAIGLIGLSFLIRFIVAVLPDVSVPLPDVSIPWRDIPWPSVTLPGWVQWIFEQAKYWAPILTGIVIALVELRRRRKGSGPGTGGEAGEKPGAGGARRDPAA